MQEGTNHTEQNASKELTRADVLVITDAGNADGTRTHIRIDGQDYLVVSDPTPPEGREVDTVAFLADASGAVVDGVPVAQADGADTEGCIADLLVRLNAGDVPAGAS